MNKQRTSTTKSRVARASTSTCNRLCHNPWHRPRRTNHLFETRLMIGRTYWCHDDHDVEPGFERSYENSEAYPQCTSNPFMRSPHPIYVYRHGTDFRNPNIGGPCRLRSRTIRCAPVCNQAREYNIGVISADIADPSASSIRDLLIPKQEDGTCMLI